MKFIRSVGYMNWHLLRREPSRDFHMQHEIMIDHGTTYEQGSWNVHVESLSSLAVADSPESPSFPTIVQVSAFDAFAVTSSAMELAIKYLIRTLDLLGWSLGIGLFWSEAANPGDQYLLVPGSLSRDVTWLTEFWVNRGRVEPKRLSCLVRGFFLFGCFPFLGT